MRAYCNSERVIALHADDQNISPAVYGEGVDVLQVPDDFKFRALNEHGDMARPTAEEIPPPQTVSPIQLRRALRAAELFVPFETHINTQSAEVIEAWEYGLYFNRQDALILGAAAALNLSTEGVDNLFRAAIGNPIPAKPRRRT